MRESEVRAVGWARSLPLTSGVRAARHWAREHLETLRWTESAPDTVDAVLLTVSELVTNAHVHARSSAQLVLTWDTDCLHVSVHDASPRLPQARPPSEDRLGGRGMYLVEALADSWETRPCPNGKTVIACFRPPTGRAAAQEESPAPGRAPSGSDA
ncbi:ATP-binding protein [Streptomyces sp. NBC_01497]|uniref:ATP-binding protein n=1 Tax=Streptomyces sp. NBC_01497 TaxID=2903885 RepID=UPI002E37DD53|nr:ATP-binding protein [Streptomyces sp. NBC_01497]